MIIISNLLHPSSIELYHNSDNSPSRPIAIILHKPVGVEDKYQEDLGSVR